MNADSSLCFIDSNIWLYAFLDMQEMSKQQTAKLLIQQNAIVISTQVLNEVSRNLLKTGAFTEAEIEEFVVAAYDRYHVLAFTKDILLKASALRRRYNFSFWDSLVVASALLADAAVLYSEDMQDQLVVDHQVRIINPFEQELIRHSDLPEPQGGNPYGNDRDHN